MTAHYKLWYALPLLLQVVIAGCGGSSAPPAGSPPPAPDPIPAPECGDGIAAEDLSGTCRATPQATMGAMEAISRGPDTGDANA
ncbi:MAG TPA: hypothetical protein VJ396_06950 [Acidiferrobacterales bacterium]|nr:hypothetical protein [Acidiferrobacterales bacterium]